MVYVDDLNLLRTPEELTKTVDYLKNEFEMKDLSKTKFCLGFQIEHLPNEILVHQSIYIEEILKHFYLDKTHPLSTPMSYRSLDVKNDHSHPQEKDEETIGLEVPYLSAIDTLMYLANCTQTYRSNPQLVGNTETCYLSDLYKSRSQIEYLSTCDNC